MPSPFSSLDTYLGFPGGKKLDLGDAQGSGSKLCLQCEIPKNSPLPSTDLFLVPHELQRAKRCGQNVRCPPWLRWGCPAQSSLGVTGGRRLHSLSSKCCEQQDPGDARQLLTLPRLQSKMTGKEYEISLFLKHTCSRSLLSEGSLGAYKYYIFNSADREQVNSHHPNPDTAPRKHTGNFQLT